MSNEDDQNPNELDPEISARIRAIRIRNPEFGRSRRCRWGERQNQNPGPAAILEKSISSNAWTDRLRKLPWGRTEGWESA